ncbi:Zn-dependent hydrolase [Kineosporia sp. NBRC 101677]|uniref:allantoate amidohydrolase n=1 Tax=Kineosporia sp. NBRC 101677 TaxID=3032197 RepID=UPI0024A04822|nr:allantoate amidohydrolase [Kineosporia sp. NBRC 101677]GLY14227.1 Zn-dependent hydrolase [Kineosporia sp. NBRC 101677]
MSFTRRWAELEPIGRASSGGYRRFAWTPEDASLREWFAGEVQALGLDLTVDRAGNQWAWWGDPDSAPGVVTGSHLDSVPDGGAFDGPLGVVSALAAVETLRSEGFRPARPIGVVNFVDEEGARFGVACAGSRVITGAMTAERASGLRDGEGVSLGEAMQRAGLRPEHLGRDEETLRRIGVFVELHVEQGKALATDEFDAAIGVGTAIWPHGRWRFDFPGEANHAGTTRLVDRKDPMLAYASTVLAARQAAERNQAVATFGKLTVEPNGVNAIPSLVRAWLDARAPSETDVQALLRELSAEAEALGATVSEESWTGNTLFDPELALRLSKTLGGAPLLGTGAGHDAGILATAGVSTAMLFVRNPTGMSHTPSEFAEESDCLAGVDALTTVLRELAA